MPEPRAAVRRALNDPSTEKDEQVKNATDHGAVETAASMERATDAVESTAVALADEELSGEQLAEARRYGRAQLVCDLADKALDLVFLGTMAFWAARPLDAWLSRGVSSEVLRLGLLFLITMGLHEIVSLPLSFYVGHVLEHRFGLSQQTAARWLRRHMKAYGLAVLFGLVLFSGLFWLIRWTGAYWWLVGAGAFFLLSVVLGQLAPVLILPLFYKVEKLDDAELLERMQRLAEGTGLSIEGVYRLVMSDETVKANAMLAGLGRTRRVLIGDTLLENFSPEEIEVIFAHEVGHHVFGHLRKMLLAGLIYSAAGFWVCDRILMTWLSWQEGGAVDYASLPVYALPMVMFVLAVFSMVVEPLQNTISRRYERQCDRYALERTGNRTAYRSAFHKLARLNKDDPNPPRLAVVLFHSHPPISERLALADR